jgi:hypothetical protein
MLVKEENMDNTEERVVEFCRELTALSKKCGIEIVAWGKYGVELKNTDNPTTYIAVKGSATSNFPYQLIFCKEI